MEDSIISDNDLAFEERIIPELQQISQNMSRIQDILVAIGIRISEIEADMHALKRRFMPEIPKNSSPLRKNSLN